MQIWVQWLELIPFAKECRIWEVYQKLVFEDGGVQKSFLPLIFDCNLHGLCFYSLLLPGKRSKSPGTRDASGGSSFVQKLPFRQHSSVGGEPCRSSLFVSFSGAAELVQLSALCVRITNTQTVIAFGELWLHSLCNLQVNLRYARLHKPSHLIRKTDGLSTVMLTVPVEF